ncbi:unnamed protein product (macronuclear) [Paramecium tetraurelia]|uniref:Uncharacterized protein n=1 Tax=Paramecium tetraurelia TaxID=5888 RepID=A0E6U5_PARTE|nr:uncharacterized protein GSPATT00023740001 [Paramecium tetraurelia]CAK91012.1 unnamed protein product [Paramecium tetraurelia]|eukprot:XP_001458409.1 hypothetical protein (macronuclear) [Paramecium tetraurelia strain d4-2]
MQSDYYESDNIEVLPEEYNEKMTPKEKVTLKEQIEFLQQQTALLKQSMELEQELQVDNPIAYLNAIENNLESLKVTNLQQRIQCLAILGSGAEKCVTLKCVLPQSDNLKRFQMLEKQVHLLETIVGQKPYQNNSTIMQDLNEVQSILNSIQAENKDIKLGFTQTLPQIDKINEIFRLVQLLVGIADLLPNIITRLEQLKNAHDQSIQYQNQLKELQIKHTKVLDLITSNRARIKALCTKLAQK